MAKINYTKNNKQESIEAIEIIKFFTYNKGVYSHNSAQSLKRATSSSERRTKDSIMYIQNDSDPSKNVIIETVFHAEMLIKALQKAIELSWLKGK